LGKFTSTANRLLRRRKPAAEISVDRLPEYVVAVESAAAAAVKKRELAYMAVVDAEYRRILVSAGAR
jgi:hypothetical protein